MEFIKQLAAFVSAVEANGGIIAWRPEGLEDLWIAFANAADEDRLRAGLSSPTLALYQAWTDKYSAAQSSGMTLESSTAESETDPAAEEQQKSVKQMADDHFAEQMEHDTKPSPEPEPAAPQEVKPPKQRRTSHA
jgi:hypothetical protein